MARQRAEDDAAEIIAAPVVCMRGEHEISRHHCGTLGTLQAVRWCAHRRSLRPRQAESYPIPVGGVAE